MCHIAVMPRCTMMHVIKLVIVICITYSNSVDVDYSKCTGNPLQVCFQSPTTPPAPYHGTKHHMASSTFKLDVGGRIAAVHEAQTCVEAQRTSEFTGGNSDVCGGPECVKIVGGNSDVR